MAIWILFPWPFTHTFPISYVPQMGFQTNQTMAQLAPFSVAEDQKDGADGCGSRGLGASALACHGASRGAPWDAPWDG